jgi:transposase-like protein
MIKYNKDEIKFNNLLDVQQRFPDEKSCRDYLIQVRWNGQMVCVHCGSIRKFYPINDGELYKCADCRKNFSIRVGTIFEDTKIPLQKWFFAIFLFSSHKKGISSAQLGRDIGVRQATAWHILHRIRYGMTPKKKEQLKNIVEADETYVGGRHHRGKRGRGSENKTAIFGLAERQGEVRTQPIKRVNSSTLKKIIRENVSKEATLVTDDWMAYSNLSKEYKHQTINHSIKEYVKGTVHTNNIENFWSLLKRGIIGIYHQVSAKHLHRYCDEFQFRYNARKISDTSRFTLALSQCEGRLMYKDLIKV